MQEFILSVVGLCLIVFIGYARYIEPYKFTIKKIKVDHQMHLKIVHIADIHYGKNYTIKELEKLVKAINELEKDLIVFTGDFFDDRYNGGLDDIVEVLLRLDKDVKKYAVWGNHDYKHHAKDVYADLMRQSGFILLENTDELVQIQEQSLRIVGSDDYLMGTFNKEYLENVDDNHYNILLLHEPDVVDFINYAKYDLILSGHSHGGQVVLPFGIRGKTRFGSKYQEGLFVLSHRTKLYVSSGLGTTGTRLRFNVKPSISVLEI